MAPVKVEERDKEAKEAKEENEAKEGKEETEERVIRQRRGSDKRTQKKPKKTGAKEILSAALQTEFTNPAAAQEFESRYKEKMRKKPGNQIFHVLAKSSSLPENMQWPDRKVKEFLDWALERHHALLEVKNDDQYTPLHLALMDRNTTFVDAVLLNSKLINLAAVLLETCQYGNSLHVAIKYRLPSIKLMVEKSAQINKMFEKGQPETGNTPLHACMSMDMDEHDDDSDVESEFDDDDDEDSQSHSLPDPDHESETPIADEHHHHHQELKNLGWVPIENGLGKRKPTHVELKHPTTTGRRESHALPLQRAQSFMVPTITESTSRSIQLVQLLIQKHHAILWQHNTAKRTPYQERIHRLRTSKAIENELAKAEKTGLEDKAAAREELLQRIVAKDPIASYIRSYCVKEFPRDRIMACLYQPGQERHIEFDLGGLPHPTISEDYLDRLSKHLQFESIMKYVALPKITMESPAMVRKKKRGEQPPHRRGLSDLVAVFNWLRRNHVEKIVKIMVIDDGDPSHADASIEEALEGFGIEIWDWKRLDLSTEVICKSTKVVQEISLYSSGNNAVLMGWASPQGLPNKTKFPDLKKVNLFIREGQEDQQRLMTYINSFKNTIKRETNDRVKVHHILDNKDVSYASELKSTEGHLQPETPWIDCVVSFARLLRRAPGARSVHPVKIAIIDDGVDASLIRLDGKIAIGKSFCPYANSTDLMSPYYVPSGNHGTCMATLISKICPEVSLYVARLDERQAVRGSQRQITAKSAADAIRWATDCGVDIISMSWTIETPVTGNDDMESLKTAVRDATGNDILMFCSTSDQGSSTKDNCYPGDFPGCIKIGGATNTGEALAWVNADKVDFLLPGKNVPFDNNEGKVISYESGSSVATAAASGLAGLLMFCSWLLKEDNKSFQDQKNMDEAFKALAQQTKFPRMQEVFEQRFKQALAKLEPPNPDQKLKQPPPEYDISTMSWDDNCKEALDTVMGWILPTN